MRRTGSGARRGWAALLALAVVLPPGAARGHQSSIAYSDIVVDGADVDYKLQVASADLYPAVGLERERPVTRDEVLAARAHVLEYLLARVHVEARGAACPGQAVGLELLDKSEGFFALARLRFRCPRLVEEARVRYDLLFDLDPRHQGIARVAFGDEEGREQVFRDGARTLELRRQLGPLDHARQYALLGVEHIFTGYDHIAFLFGLLIVAGAHGLRAGARKILGVVTAFTVAHSVTLIASALGSTLLSPLRVVPAVALVLVGQLALEDRLFAGASRGARAGRAAAAAALGYLGAAALGHAVPTVGVDPSRVIEASIALSIVYVGLENLAVAAPAHRFLLTFCFGLVHGFGFASVLREIGLPERGLLLSLVSFNVGVEIGQLAVVAAVLPLLAVVARPFAGGSRALAAELGVLGAVAVATFALLRAFDVPLVPLAIVTFAGAPLLYGLGRRLGYDPVVRLGGSTIIALLATFWFLERVTARTWLGGHLG